MKTNKNKTKTLGNKTILGVTVGLEFTGWKPEPTWTKAYAVAFDEFANAIINIARNNIDNLDALRIGPHNIPEGETEYGPLAEFIMGDMTDKLYLNLKSNDGEETWRHMDTTPGSNDRKLLDDLGLNDD